jgi:hypothetical protein
MSICITHKCDNKEMTEIEREQEFLAGWPGISMYDHICSNCFNEMKEII